jgi:hypothetical protein
MCASMRLIVGGKRKMGVGDGLVLPRHEARDTLPLPTSGKRRSQKVLETD